MTAVPESGSELLESQTTYVSFDVSPPQEDIVITGLTLGETTSGKTDINNYQYFSYTPGEDGVYVLRTADFDFSFENWVHYVYVYDENQEEIDCTKILWNGKMEITAVLKKDRTYCYKLRRDVVEEGRTTYYGAFEVIMTKPECTEVNLDQVIYISGSNADAAFVMFCPQETGSYTFSLSSDYDKQMKIYDSGMNILASGSRAGSNTATVDCELTGNQAYYCAIIGSGQLQVLVEYNTPPVIHEWGEATYEWNEDNSRVTATRVCTLDTSHVETEEAATTSEITKAATCEENGETTYTSAAFANPAFTVQTKTVDNIPALTHDWGEPVYEWNENYSRVTAKRVCTRDADHVETETAETVRELVTAPTEEEAGTYQIVSKAFDHPAFAIQKKENLVIPALNSLNVFRLPASLKTIETEAFEGIAAEAVIIPDSCETIEPKAFVNCQNLLYIRIPAETEISDEAFSGCPVVVIDQR